jgi:hypothetical protein
MCFSFIACIGYVSYGVQISAVADTLLYSFFIARVYFIYKAIRDHHHTPVFISIKT